MDPRPHPLPLKGRGALSNPEGRFESARVEWVDDGWESHHAEELPAPATTVEPERTRRIISRNSSPDVPFEQSINPYRGCEHGCIYCYARPSHAYLSLSPGLDFETRLFYKAGATRRLEEEPGRPGYVCKPITLGANTDPYQPVERRFLVTRSLLEVLQRFRHPVTIITKGSLVLRDIDLLAELARHRLAAVIVSVTTLDNAIKRTLEPRAASPRSRLCTIERLVAAGVPGGVLVAPVIPAITDPELESILDACAQAGARSAGYVLLRLPYEVKDLFREWLEAHAPQKAAHVMSLIRQCRGGRDYDPRFGHRQSGTGQWAGMLAQRFQAACRRLELNTEGRPRLTTDLFRLAPAKGGQLELGL